MLASVRTMNRLELLAETLRAALNELAAAAPEWLRGVAPAAWYERYARRIEDSRLPQSKAEREAYARTVGQDGFTLLDRLEGPRARPSSARCRWSRCSAGSGSGTSGATAAGPGAAAVRLRPEGELRRPPRGSSRPTTRRPATAASAGCTGPDTPRS